MTRKGRFVGGAVLAGLFAGALWFFLRPRAPAPDAPDEAPSLSPAAALPDQKSPDMTADNSSHSGLAPGFSPAAGEVEEKITVMASPSRVLVRAPDEKGVALPEPSGAPDAGLESPEGVVSPVQKEDSTITPNANRDPSALILPPSGGSIDGEDTPPPPKKSRKKRPR